MPEIDQFDVLEAIAHELDYLSPIDDWENVKVEAERMDDDENDITNFKFDIQFMDSTGKTASPEALGRLGEYFQALALLVSTEEKGYYKMCYLSLTSQGKVNVDYKYE